MTAIPIPVSRLLDSSQAAELFRCMLPTIEDVASFEFRRVPRHRRQELVNDAVALAYVAFARLFELGRVAVAYPSALARYAVKKIRSGRRVGVKQNIRDVLSPLARRKSRFSVELLSDRDSSGEWEELATGRNADPALIAACRIDFRHWLSQLEQFKRRVALRLARGDSTGEVARQFELSFARISQVRRELKCNWDRFQAVP